MTKLLSLIILLFLLKFVGLAQNPTNIIVTNTTAANILKGTYAPATYNTTTFKNIPDTIVKALMTKINQDSIKAYWLKLGTFYNRNTGNQLASTTLGITASVDWVNAKFQEFSTANSNRLVVSNITFNETICSRTSHKEPMAIIPGSSTTDKSIMVLCAHIDSRTDVLCPVSTVEARGMEDNATGVAALMELARVMSQYSYTRTIVFLVTVAEEQTLSGADALVKYLNANTIPVRGNINNDQLGTMICRTPASTPGCTVNNSVDTNSVRIFSRRPTNIGVNNFAKSWTRYIKQTYIDKALPTATIPMNIRIMTDIDRTGRGGDHEQFDLSGFAAARLMCANEAGDGSGANTRIHSIKDIGGADTNSDGSIDSFFVSFSYLQRNTMINGLALAQAASAQTPPTYTITNLGNNNIRVVINTETAYPKYRIGVRTTKYDYDSVYTVAATTNTIVIPVSPNGHYYISVAGMDDKNVNTFFGTEQDILSSLTTLGVKYVSFTANKKNRTSELKFLIEEPIIGSVFFIERSIDGRSFSTIGSIYSTNTDKNYSFIDSVPIINNINYYRIKELDLYGRVKYSNITFIKFNNEATFDVYPSPASTNLNVLFTEALQNKPSIISMYNNVGQMVYSKKINQSNGNEKIDVSNFINGMYVVKIVTENGILNKTVMVVR